MYNIPYFKASNHEEVLQFMQAHPFIILCGASADGTPVATHVPVLFEEREDRLFLLAHVMKKQGHTEAFFENNQVLAIFMVPPLMLAPVGTKTKRSPARGITRQFM